MWRETPPVRLKEWFVRAQTGRSRAAVAAILGACASFVAAWVAPWQLTVLIGWDVTALCVIVPVWTVFSDFDARETAAFALREDNTRTQTHLLLLGAALMSLVGVALIFVKANEGSRPDEVLLEAAGVFTIACSWVLVHTVFALRYADVYYTEPKGGIDFKSHGADHPDYRDFAYTAFTVGMTFQVSDTDITQREMRHDVLRHAIVSFLFGAVILSTTVNVIAGLLDR